MFARAHSKIIGRRPHARPHAFTLVEMLIVIAIIVLLISILLPSFRWAREQARIVKCGSNMREIGKVMSMYFLEHNDWFPFEKRNLVQQGTASTSGFYYGGHPGRPVHGDEESQWYGYVKFAFRTTPYGRPFNRYFYPDLPDFDIPSYDPLFDVVRDMPVYTCPSDDGGYWNTQTSDYKIGIKPIHYYTGSSFVTNHHFGTNWAMRRDPTRWQQIANAFLRQQFRTDSARFVILFEDPFDSAQWNRMSRVGWHGRRNRHTLLFLDGHVANMLADTTLGASGPGWKTCSGNSFEDPRAFWNDPDDPDYRHRNIIPLPAYE